MVSGVLVKPFVKLIFFHKVLRISGQNLLLIGEQ